LDEFHFSMEAFGDAIVFGEAPHGCEGFAPGVESLCEGDKRDKGTGVEFVDELKQSAYEGTAGTFGLVFYIHEGADGVHFFIEGFERGIFVEEVEEALMVKRSEVVGALAQGGQQAPVILDLGSDLAGKFHEVMDDDTDDMEAVGDDFCIWEVGGDEAAVRTGEVDADHTHLIPALETLQVGAQIGFAATRDDVEDAVVFKVGEGGGKAQSLVKGVFVDT